MNLHNEANLKLYAGFLISPVVMYTLLYIAVKFHCLKRHD